MAVLLPIASMAQEEPQKQYIPEEGEWAIGFDAVPMLNFIGNAFNSSTSNEIAPLGGSPSVTGKNIANGDLLPTYSIMGKYMLTDEWALRANVGLLLSNTKDRGYVTDQKATTQDPFSGAKLIDTKTTANTGASITLGAEYRKGKNRIQGIFGGGLLVAMTSQSIKYTYGNGMSQINQHPETYFSGAYLSNGYRQISTHDKGLNVIAGVTGNAGIEWFVAPKIALGAEMNISLYYRFGTQTYVESEGYNTSTDKVEIRTDISTPGNRGFYFGTESLGGSLYMMFYF